MSCGQAGRLRQLDAIPDAASSGFGGQHEPAQRNGRVLHRGTRIRSTGLLNTGWLSKRASRQWAAAGLQPITLQEARHTAATWLDAAGVPPKIASVLMGHATPERQPGAAQITLARYTHALPEDIEKARAKLAAYLLENQPSRVAAE